MGALFDESEVRGIAEAFAHLGELCGEQFAEDGTDADAGEKVAVFPGARLIRRVVAAVRMVERDGHELVEADGPVLCDAAAEEVRGSVRAG